MENGKELRREDFERSRRARAAKRRGHQTCGSCGSADPNGDRRGGATAEGVFCLGSFSEQERFLRSDASGVMIQTACLQTCCSPRWSADAMARSQRGLPHALRPARDWLPARSKKSRISRAKLPKQMKERGLQKQDAQQEAAVQKETAEKCLVLIGCATQASLLFVILLCIVEVIAQEPKERCRAPARAARRQPPASRQRRLQGSPSHEALPRQQAQEIPRSQEGTSIVQAQG